MDNSKNKTNPVDLLWPKITNISEANLALRSAVRAWYWIAGIQMVAGFFVLHNISYLIEPALMAASAFWLQKSKAKWVSWLLAASAVFCLIGTAINILNNSKVGINLIMSLVLIAVAITGIRATRYISGHDSNRSNSDANSSAA